ncbi:MAG: hypothetical protein JNM17_15420 [Archangium sp.]|nr:hypothetical protein [Archangium sp.]
MNLLRARAPLIALLVAVVVSVPSLWSGIFVDDYFHGIKIERLSPLLDDDLFSFATGNPEETNKLILDGPYPWWTWPNVRFQFFRPLSSWLAKAEHHVFGRSDVPKHVHSILWFLALVVVVNQLYRRALEPKGQERAGLWAPATTATSVAMLLFALDDVHWMPMMWIANRNALISAVPVLIGVLLHVRSREDGWAPGRWFALPFVAIGLAGGESALGAVSYLLAYEAFAARDSWVQRAKALAPLAVLGLGYIVLYKAAHAGAKGSGIYIDPIGEPGAFLLAAPGRMLALAGAQLLGSSSDLWLISVASRPALVAFGVLAVALCFWLMKTAVWPQLDDDARRKTRWLVGGMALSLVPVSATFPLNRLLLLPSVGGAAIVALILTHVSWKSGGARYAAGLLFFANVVIAPVMWAGSYYVGGFMARGQITSALETPLTDAQLSKRVVIFNVPDPALALYPSLVRLWYAKPVSKRWFQFSMAPFPHRLARTAENTVELEVVNGRMMQTVFEQLLRSETLPLPIGFTSKLNGATVTVIALDDELPSKLRIDFENLSSDEWTWVQWKDQKFQSLTMPAVGETIDLPLEPGLVPIQ